MDQQLYFPWYTEERHLHMENHMDVDRIKAMLDSAPRITELLARREVIMEEHDKLTLERQAIDGELETLTGQPAAPATNGRAKQKCSICGSDEHDKARCPTKGDA